MTMSVHSHLGAARIWALALLIVCVGLRGAETGFAAPLYSGSLNIFGALETVSDSPSPVVLGDLLSLVDTDPAGNVIGQKTTASDAVASYGRVKGNSLADYLNVREFFPIFSGANIGSGGSAAFLLDDLIISGPPGNFLVSFNYSITGSAFATAGTTTSMYSAAEARASMNLQSTFGGAGYDLGYLGVDSTGTHIATGIFSTFPANGDGGFVGTTPDILTYAGDTAVRFGLGIQTSAVASVGYGAVPGYAYASSNVFHTFGFPTSGPVANLPEGYTLNSVSGHIVNNRFVPEPSSLTLLALGSAAVLQCRRRWGCRITGDLSAWLPATKRSERL